MKDFFKRFWQVKRFKAGVWIAGAGFVASVLTIFLQSIDEFQFNETTKVVVIIVATAIISQITKAVNTSKE